MRINVIAKPRLAGLKQSILFIVVCLSVTLLPALIFAQEIPNQQIIINEIGLLEPSETEWIEIYNKGPAALDLNGWKFFEDQTNHGLNLFRAKTGTTSPLVEADEYAIIANKADEFAKKYPDYSGAIFDSSWGSLKEDGEEIGLKDVEGNFIELFSYPAVKGNLISLERIDTNISASEPTNWLSHPSSNSIGKPNENSLPAQLQPAPAALSPANTTASESPAAAANALSPQTETAAATSAQPQTNPQSAPTASPPTPSAPPQTIIITQNPLNSPPKAIIQIQSGSLITVNSTTVNFDGRQSFDPDGSTLTFLWDMGDGTKETTANPPPHKYGKPGTYIITLTVTDPSGLQNQAQEYVQVVNKSMSVPLVATSTSQTHPQQIFLPLTSSSLPKNLYSDGITFEIQGFLVLKPSADDKKIKQKKKQSTSKSAAKTKKAKKTPAKKSKPKTVFKNGDVSDAIKITEIYPNPANGEEEWIEIYNSGSANVNLGNWMLADSAKASAPHQISDTVILRPNEYHVFKKSETKIVLNNDSDEIFLKDFKGDEIDKIKYSSSQKENSYALININENQPAMPSLVASAQAVPANSSSIWEWTWELSPGKENPTFEKITGLVSRLIAGGGFTVATPNGGEKIINFDEKILDPLVAEVVLREKSEISVHARKNDDGTYNLKKIEQVKPAPDEKKEKSYIMWVIIGVIAVSVLLNGIPVVKLLYRKFINTNYE